jgi:hypothetical protein
MTMNKTMQIYYHAIFGALGGLFGWWLMGSLGTQTWQLWLEATVVGAGLGFWIGGMVAATDGAMIKRVWLRAVRDGVLGALAGTLAGILGLLLAHAVWSIFSGGLIARALTWMLFGLFIGMSDIAVSRRKQRTLYAALGGMAGGLAGGIIYEGMTQLFLNQVQIAQVAIGGLGLVIIGGCIGGLIPLARQVLARGELHVLSGQQVGLVREVTDLAHIGSYDGNDIYLPDAGISWRHATIRRTAAGFELTVLPESEHGIEIGADNGAITIAPGSTRPLQPGDQFRMGEALVQFVGK